MAVIFAVTIGYLILCYPGINDSAEAIATILNAFPPQYLPKWFTADSFVAITPTQTLPVITFMF